MKVLPVNPFVPALLQTVEERREPAGAKDFSSVLKKALDEVGDLQRKADEAARNLVLGNDVDVHQVMIATEQAQLAMQLTIQIRNKLIDAYQEISRMQI